MRLLYVLLLFCIGTNAAGVWPDTGEDSNSGYMSSAYGPRDKTSGEGYTYDFHRGIDIANPNSNGVYAFSGGTFEYVDWSSDWGYHVVIHHTDDVNTFYGHLDLTDNDVIVGESATESQYLGYWSSVNHLHFSFVEDPDGDDEWGTGVFHNRSYHPMRFLSYDADLNDNNSIENFFLDRENKTVSFDIKIDGNILDCNDVQVVLVDIFGDPKQSFHIWYEDWADNHSVLYNSDLDDDTPDITEPTGHDMLIVPDDFEKTHSHQVINYTIYFTVNIDETDTTKIDLFGPELGNIGRLDVPMNPYHTTSIDIQTLPEKSQLLPVYPNPFNSSLTIPFNLGISDRGNIKIYDINGRLVRDKQLSHNFRTSYNQVIWDGTDKNGLPVSSGIYFVQFITQESNLTKRVIYLK